LHVALGGKIQGYVAIDEGDAENLFVGGLIFEKHFVFPRLSRTPLADEQ